MAGGVGGVFGALADVLQFAPTGSDSELAGVAGGEGGSPSRARGGGGAIAAEGGGGGVVGCGRVVAG